MDREERARLQADLTRLADGDRSAFQPVFLLVWPLLRRLASRHLPAQDAEDVAQQALLRVFLRASEFDARRDALAWIAGVGLWEVRSALRRAGRRREVTAAGALLEEVRAAGADPEQIVVQAGLSERLGDALGGLRPADAATLAAYAEERRPAVGAATFRKRVQRALARLRDRWRDLDGES